MNQSASSLPSNEGKVRKRVRYTFVDALAQLFPVVHDISLRVSGVFEEGGYITEDGKIFDDPLSLEIIKNAPSSNALFFVFRSRFKTSVEDPLVEAEVPKQIWAG